MLRLFAYAAIETLLGVEMVDESDAAPDLQALARERAGRKRDSNRAE